MTSGAHRDATKTPRTLGPGAESVSSTLDLANFSDDELARLLDDGQRELTTRRERQRAEFLVRVVEEAAAVGLDAHAVARALTPKGKRPRADGRSEVKPKYRNPDDATQTWSGRGACPKWLQALLDGGAELQSFRVPPGGA